MTRMAATLQDDQNIFWLYSLRMWNVSDKTCREVKNTYFML